MRRTVLREFLDTPHNVERVEVLPYYTIKKIKRDDIGIKYELEDIPLPTEE